MQFFIGYMIFLTFTVGLLLWVFLIKTQLTKKTKTILSAVILILTFILSIIFMSFLPFKWMNIVYYLLLLVGFCLLVLVVYIIVALITNLWRKHKGEEQEKIDFKALKQKVQHSMGQVVAKKETQKAEHKKQTKAVANTQNKKAMAKQKTAVKQKEKASKEKTTTSATKASKKTKNYLSSLKAKKNKDTKQTQSSKEAVYHPKKVKPKDKKPQNRRLEDYEPPRESKVSSLKKPEKTSFGHRRK